MPVLLPSIYFDGFSSDLTDLFNSRLLLFSFGSGSAAAMFSITVTNTIEKLVGLRASADDAHRRLNNRVKQTPDEYAVAMSMRESLSNLVAHRLHFDQQKGINQFVNSSS
jgi:3-hydroxy-3-methylglutaryl CoA synthase